MAVLSPERQVLWSNQVFGRLSEEIKQAVRELCSKLMNGDSPVSGVLHTALSPSADQACEIVVGAQRDAQQRLLRFVTLVTDASASRRMVAKMNSIDQAGRELVGIDPEAIRKLSPTDRLALLEEKVVRFCGELLHFDHFAIRVLDAANGRLDTVLAHGFSEEAKGLEISAGAQGQGISGYVAATGESYICPDVTRDPRFLPGMESARSSLTVAIRLMEKVVGVFNIESDRVDAFTDQDRQFAEIFARYVAIALNTLQLLAIERHAAAGELAADVDAELSGPLNDIADAVAQLIVEKRDDAQLLARLATIDENLKRLRRILHDVTDPPPIRGVVPERVERDPLISGKNILVCDDDESIRETIVDVLGRYGAKTTWATDGNDAVTKILSRPLDLVLSDIKMPDKNGYEVFDAVQRRADPCPVILITGFGYDPNHSIVRASKEGLAGVLFKPFKVDQLLEQVRQALMKGPPVARS
jgi:CheY-like chemotaxis protein